MEQRGFIFGLIFFLILCFCANGQDERTNERWKEYIQQLAEDEENSERLESLYSELSYLAEHPIDLNTATAESLRRLPFLSDAQVEAILSYRQKYGALLTVYELKNIAALDHPTIEEIEPFVYVGEAGRKQHTINASNLRKHGFHQCIAEYRRTLEQKQGYRPQPDSILQRYPNRIYLGEPFYHSLRYSYTFDERIQAGFVAEKDAGEPFGNARHKGYDYYSAHLLLNDMKKWLRTFAAGDYKASFGQGLVLSHDFIPIRTTVLSSSGYRSNGFRRHYSTNEHDFFRGVAASLVWKNWTANVFYSRRKADASTDSTIITSFKTDGLHRTESERSKRHAVTMQTIGTNIRYAASGSHIGLTAITYNFGPHTVEPPAKPYNRYLFHGNRNVNASVDYMFRINTLKGYGETALSHNGAWATLNALQWTPSSSVKGIILYRRYAADYQAYFAHAFSQSNDIRNEEGVYIGWELTPPVGFWKITGYADFYRFPWMKFGVDAPSSGTDCLLQVDYSKLEHLDFYVRYRYRRRESNHTVKGHPETKILPTRHHRLRAQMLYHPTPEWSWKAAIDASLLTPEAKATSHGWMVSNTVGWKPQRLPLQTDLFIACFRTDDYQSRIYSYEKNLLYAFNSTSFYGKGMRLSTVLRYSVGYRFVIAAKIGWTHYFEGEHIGSGLETIDGRNRTDVHAMIRWKF